jgi:hypothetical protein
MFSVSSSKILPSPASALKLLFCVSGAVLGVAAHAASPQGDDSTLHLPLRPVHEAVFGKHVTEHHLGRSHASEAVAGPETVIRAKSGPWGDLEYTTVYLEASTAMLKSMEVPTYETEWVFVGYTEDQVSKLFASTDMPAAIRAELTDREKWRHRDNAITVVPSNEALLALSPEARVAIYSVLTKWEEDPYHHEPVIIFAHSVREWLQRAELSEEVVSTIEKMTYHRGRSLVFADVPLVLRLVQTDAERLKIRRALTRTPTLVVNLRITPQTDIAAIAEYWGGAKISPDIGPFLEAAADCGAPTSVDLIHLLPPTARRLIYTYPGVDAGRTGYYPDCHWTSLNFRNVEVLDRLADPALATAYVLDNYTKVQGSYRYGDVIFLMDGPSGNAIHSCVYLADDLVFTKNGRSPTQPWVVMKLDDVVTYYEMFYAPQLACYRHNGE